MKILFLSALPIEMNTSSMIRNISLIKGLESNGVDLSLIIPLKNVNSVFYDDNEEINFKNVEIIRYGCTETYKKIENIKIESQKNLLYKFLKKIYKSISINDASKISLKYASNISLKKDFFDIVITSSDPKSSHILFYKYIKRKIKYKYWIQYWGDPLFADITSRNLLPDFIIKKVEKNILKKGDIILYTSPITLEEQKKHLKKSQKKCILFQQGFIKNIFLVKVVKKDIF